MKILIIHGSPRRGNTWDVLNIVKEKINKLIDVEYEIIELTKYKFKPCTGCFNCILKGEDRCPHYSDINYITKKIDESDAIIITSPVYSLQVSGILKNFIDHMSYNFHRPRYFNKKALIITTTAGVNEKEIANYIGQVLSFWGINSIYKIPIKYRNNYLQKYEKHINKEIINFIEDLKSKKNKTPSLKNIVQYNSFKSMAMAISGEDSADYKYWKETNMCSMPYAEGIKIGKLKTLFSNSLYKILVKLMKPKK